MRIKNIFLHLILIAVFMLPAIAVSAGTVQLPQTGQTKCYNSAGVDIPCASTGQDGDIRAGVPWPNPRFTDNGDGTVTDKLTGLMWTKNANLAGTGKTWQQALTYCNNLNLAGYTDWRLPNINEIKSLLNAGVTIPATWLNNQGFTNVQLSSYWSSTTGGFLNDAFSVNMSNSLWRMSSRTKSSGLHLPYVWSVRTSSQPGIIDLPQTGQTSCYDSNGLTVGCFGTGQDGDISAGIAWTDPHFTDNGDGTLTDNLTKLMWTKNANLSNTLKTWQEALDYCNNLNFAGYNDWRLPNVNEYESLLYPVESWSAWLYWAGLHWNYVDNWSSTSSSSATNDVWYAKLDYNLTTYAASKNYTKDFFIVRGGLTNVTAITLSSFKAKQRGRKVLIKWKTSSEMDNLGFNILRSESKRGEYAKINSGLIEAKRNGVSGGKYKLKDRDVTKGKTYFYKLEDVDSNSGSTLHGPVKADVKGKAFKKKKRKHKKN